MTKWLIQLSYMSNHCAAQKHKSPHYDRAMTYRRLEQEGPLHLTSGREAEKRCPATVWCGTWGGVTTRRHSRRELRDEAEMQPEHKQNDLQCDTQKDPAGTDPELGREPARQHNPAGKQDQRVASNTFV